MSSEARTRFAADLRAARRATRSGDIDAAWARLEEAHVLSQPWAMPHVRTHVAMLVLAFRTADPREVAGQIARVVVAAPGSMSGRYPIGNTGRSRVSMFAPMPVPEDIADLLEVQ